jgi:hypothetical protein
MWQAATHHAVAADKRQLLPAAGALLWLVQVGMHQTLQGHEAALQRLALFGSAWL